MNDDRVKVGEDGEVVIDGQGYIFKKEINIILSFYIKNSRRMMYLVFKYFCFLYWVENKKYFWEITFLL